MIIQTLPITHPQTLAVSPLTRDLFAPFGEVVSNPHPHRLPSNTSPSDVAAGACGGPAEFGAVSANQGTAIQYRALASMRNLYPEDQSAGAKRSRRAVASSRSPAMPSAEPSGVPGTPRMTMFVCGARGALPSPSSSSSSASGEREEGAELTLPIVVLERHPFTSQTFVPLGCGDEKRYLVVVAPTLAPGLLDEDLPVPSSSSSSSPSPSSSINAKPLPSRGMPDLSNLRAFIAHGSQAVTYGPGTWHAPMIALGPEGSAIDFVVVQFANDVAVEDCQEVELETGEGKGGIVVKLRPGDGDLKSIGGAKL